MVSLLPMQKGRTRVGEVVPVDTAFAQLAQLQHNAGQWLDVIIVATGKQAAP
jgi:hypothetical protein